MISIAKANRGFTTDEDGAFSMSIGSIVMISIALVVMAVAIPIALEEIFSVNTTNWSTSAVLLWELTPFIIVASVIWLLVRSTGLGGAK